MSNEIALDSPFRPQDLYFIGGPNPPVGNGMLASSLDLLKADDQQVNLLYHAHAHYSIAGIGTDGVNNQFGEKSASYTNKDLSIFVPPFTNRVALAVCFQGEGNLTVKYGPSYAFSYVMDLTNPSGEEIVFGLGAGTSKDTNGINLTGNTSGTIQVEPLRLNKGAGLQINALLFLYYRNQYNIS